MTDKELLQEALDALEAALSDDQPYISRSKEAIEALRARLAQPEPEPTAYLCENAVGHKYFRWKKPSSEYKPIALYTAHATPQRIWQGLTNEEVVARANAEVFAEAFARGVAWAELKLKEKNSD